MVFKKAFVPPSIKATVVLHLMDKDDFEVDNIGFDDDCYDLLSKEFESNSSRITLNLQRKLQIISEPSVSRDVEEETDEEKRKEIAGRLSLIDSLREDVSEDLSECSDITKRIRTL